MFISLLAFSQIPWYMQQYVVTHITLSCCSLLLSHLSASIYSQHLFYSVFFPLRMYFSILSVTNITGVSLELLAPQFNLLSINSSCHLLSPFLRPSVHHLSNSPFNSLLTLCPSSTSDVGFFDSCWHLTVVPFLLFPPAWLHWMTRALVKVLLWFVGPGRFSRGSFSLSLFSECPWPPTSTPLSPQSCCQFASHMCQASSPYLRPRPCLGVTVPATVRAPWKRGFRQSFRSPERHGRRLH